MHAWSKVANEPTAAARRKHVSDAQEVTDILWGPISFGSRENIVGFTITTLGFRGPSTVMNILRDQHKSV
jgi:CRISPR/Cas system-associated protein Cas5 (RAMP superfamily)